MHNLLHLANDAKMFGSLDNISYFKYENYMQIIKRKLHQSGKPLEELSNRIFEEQQLPIQTCCKTPYQMAVYTKNNDISYLQFETFKIAKNAFHNCALLDDNSVVSVTHMLEDNGVLYIRAQHFSHIKSFFTVPCASEKLRIYLISNSNTSEIITILATRIKRKYLKLKLLDAIDSYVVIPLLHANN